MTILHKTVFNKKNNIHTTQNFQNFVHFKFWLFGTSRKPYPKTMKIHNFWFPNQLENTKIIRHLNTFFLLKLIQTRKNLCTGHLNACCAWEYISENYKVCFYCRYFSKKLCFSKNVLPGNTCSDAI